MLSLVTKGREVQKIFSGESPDTWADKHMNMYTQLFLYNPPPPQIFVTVGILMLMYTKIVVNINLKHSQ